MKVPERSEGSKKKKKEVRALGSILKWVKERLIGESFEPRLLAGGSCICLASELLGIFNPHRNVGRLSI